MYFLNYIIGPIVFWLAYRYAFSKQMVLKYPVTERGEYVLVSQNMSFLLYSIATSMVFLGPLSLVKYAVWIAILVALLFSRYQRKVDNVLVFYSIFVLWCVYTLTYTSSVGAGINVLIKYVLPFLYFAMGYNGIEDKEDLILFFKYTTVVAVVYATLIGGFSYKVTPWLYFGLNGIVITYASLADFFTCLICIPVAMYLLTKEKKYLFAAIWMFISTLLLVVRTGLGGIAIALSLFAFIVYRLKALPYVAVIGCLFVATIYCVPEVHDKMFGEKETTTKVGLNANGKRIETNGREYFWEWAKAKYYKGHEMTGSGVGTAAAGLKKQVNGALLHSDYVQMKCEIGDVGLGLFIIFAAFAFLKTLIMTIQYRGNFLLTIVGAIAVGSLGGMLFSMAFDNVVTYSQQAFVIPFVLFGIFSKCIDLGLE